MTTTRAAARRPANGLAPAQPSSALWAASSAGQFNALLEGRDPRAPETNLRASTSQPAVAALDLTFSAPKSVSVLFAVAPAEVSAALVDCHEEAVRAALGYLEDEAVFVRRGKGGARFEHGGWSDRRGVPAPDEPGVGSAAAHACRRGEPGAWGGRPVHGAASPVDLPGGADGGVPLPGASAVRGA